jgi:uncharacterized DUF497 family protein
MNTQVASQLPYSYRIGMRWEEDEPAATWLATGPAVEWDDGNTAKLAKHKFTRADVESALRGPVVFLGRLVDPDPAHGEPRWTLLSLTARSRPMAVIFTRRGDRLRPISCRAMRRNEWRYYGEVRDRDRRT